MPNIWDTKQHFPLFGYEQDTRVRNLKTHISFFLKGKKEWIKSHTGRLVMITFAYCNL